MIEKSDLDVRRTGGLALVFGLGVGFASVHIVHGLSEGEDLETALFGIVIPAALALVLVGCGYWLRASEFDCDGVFRVGVWCLLGALAMSAAGALIVLYQRAEGVAVSDGAFVVANAATFGSVVGFVVGVYDSRQRSTNEKLLVERDHVERLNQRLTVLNRVLRHDIRTHVNVVNGHVSLLRTEGERGDRSLGIIERRMSEIGRLSDDARRVERLLGGATTDTDSLDVVSVIDEQAERLRRDDRGVGIVLDCPDHEYVATNGLLDAALRNVFDGVVDNGTSERTRLGVSMSRVSVDDAAYAEIAIESNDIEAADRDLDALTRNDVETPLDHASGLGLWLARWIVEESGGRIAIERATDGPTTITIRLRRVDPVAPAHETSRIDRPASESVSRVDERAVDVRLVRSERDRSHGTDGR